MEIDIYLSSIRNWSIGIYVTDAHDNEKNRECSILTLGFLLFGIDIVVFL